MRFSLAFIALAISSVSAQAQNYTSSLNMTIDPNTVPQARRASWCNAQTNTCYALCDNDTSENSCSQSTLEYTCNCSSNNSAPGLEYYSQTVPTFICQELFSQCNDQNTGSARGQQDCEDNIQDLCAKQDPPSPSDDDDEDSTTTASETETETSTATAVESDASATEDSVTSTSSDGFAAPTMAPAGKGAAAAVALGMLAYLV